MLQESTKGLQRREALIGALGGQGGQGEQQWLRVHLPPVEASVARPAIAPTKHTITRNYYRRLAHLQRRFGGGQPWAPQLHATSATATTRFLPMLTAVPVLAVLPVAARCRRVVTFAALLRRHMSAAGACHAARAKWRRQEGPGAEQRAGLDAPSRPL